jgi:hypothetical protein
MRHGASCAGLFDLGCLGSSNGTTAWSGLARRGLRHMMPSCIVAGVLLRTERRGLCRATPKSERRIAAVLAARVREGKGRP